MKRLKETQILQQGQKKTLLLLILIIFIKHCCVHGTNRLYTEWVLMIITFHIGRNSVHSSYSLGTWIALAFTEFSFWAVIMCPTPFLRWIWNKFPKNLMSLILCQFFRDNEWQCPCPQIVYPLLETKRKHNNL